MQHPERPHSFFQYFLNRELSELYFTIAGRSFAIALIAVFVPIFLYQTGFDLKYIFLFYAITSVVFALTSYFSAKLSTNIGIKHGILLSMPFLIIHYILLQFITTNSLNWIFFTSSIVAGIHSSLFWVNFHIDFASFSTKRLRTEQVGGYNILCMVLSALGPVIGGFILINLGFNFLFILVSSLLFISAIPLFTSTEFYTPKELSFSKVKRAFRRLKFEGISGFLGYALISCALLGWTIMIFIILEEYLEVGSLTSISLFIAMASTFFVGRLADRHGKRNILRIGAALTSFGWFLRMFVATALHVLGINIFFGLVSPASAGGPAYDAINYDMARKRKNIPEIIIARETVLHASTAAFMFLLFFFPSIYFAFILGIIGSLLTILFSYQKKKV